MILQKHLIYNVSHDIILHKLKYDYEVDGLMLLFLRSYLQGRQQQVVVGGFTSTKLPALSGVPQGSILGPFLFTFYLLMIFFLFFLLKTLNL